MRKVIIAASIAATAAGLVLAGHAIGGQGGNFKVIHADELARLLATNDPKLAVYDANDADFRAKQGIIPGAKLLSSFNRYDVAKELPAAKDAALVFYCANTF